MTRNEKIMQSLYTIIDNTMYNRLLLHTFLVVLCHRKIMLGQYHGSYHPSAPRVAIGPYRPWEGRYPPPLASASYPTLPAGHPGYQTNIIIDQTGKVGWLVICYSRLSCYLFQGASVVEITTEDLSTGLEVGRTEWSGRNNNNNNNNNNKNNTNNNNTNNNSINNISFINNLILTKL